MEKKNPNQTQTKEGDILNKRSQLICFWRWEGGWREKKGAEGKSDSSYTTLLNSALSREDAGLKKRLCISF